MRYQFTPGAERAVQAASAWKSNLTSDQLQPIEMLLGLLAEPECRAALILAEHGIDEAAIRQHWPGLIKLSSSELPGTRLFAPQLDAAVQAAEFLLFEYPRPLQLATEHLLLGLVAEEGGEVSAWLCQRGLDSHELESDIHRRSGHQPGPLPVEFPDEPRSETAPTASDEVGALRMIDAAANRAGEGLRVIEDYLRFVREDAMLTRECKQLRHELTSALASFSLEDRLASRDTQRDVGTEIMLADEQQRLGMRQVVTASFKRVEQALRSLEELAKLADHAVAARLEQLRYRTYTLERAVGIGVASELRLAEARLYVLIDAGQSEQQFSGLVTSLVAAGVHVIQLREKNLPDRALLDRARLLADVTRDTNTLFIMNDRPDLAALAGADGVHLGQDELSVKDARSIVGPRALIGVSTHSIEQARQAVLDGANYIGVGPTFSSATKQFTHFPGLELVQQVASEIRLPAFAIGGIDRENLAQVCSAGLSRVAVSSAVCRAADPATAARELLALL